MKKPVISSITNFDKDLYLFGFKSGIKKFIKKFFIDVLGFHEHDFNRDKCDIGFDLNDTPFTFSDLTKNIIVIGYVKHKQLIIRGKKVKGYVLDNAEFIKPKKKN